MPPESPPYSREKPTATKSDHFSNFLGTLILDHICFIAQKPEGNPWGCRKLRYRSTLYKTWVPGRNICLGPLYSLSIRANTQFKSKILIPKYCGCQTFIQKVMRLLQVKASEGSNWCHTGAAKLRFPMLVWWDTKGHHLGHHGFALTLQYEVNWAHIQFLQYPGWGSSFPPKSSKEVNTKEHLTPGASQNTVPGFSGAHWRELGKINDFRETWKNLVVWFLLCLVVQWI